jgi:hypothetical protein
MNPLPPNSDTIQKTWLREFQFFVPMSTGTPLFIYVVASPMPLPQHIDISQIQNFNLYDYRTSGSGRDSPEMPEQPHSRDKSL